MVSSLIGCQMRNELTYEWVVEYCDENGDIQDLNHSEILKDLGVGSREHPQGWVQVALTRIVGNEDYGMLDRRYAYIDPDTGKLPAEFDTGHKVPNRFHEQVVSMPFKIDHPTDDELIAAEKRVAAARQQIH